MEDINARYNQDIEDFFAEKLAKDYIELGTPGKILSEYLKSNNKIIVEKRNLEYKRVLHDLKKKHLVNLPELLNDPILIFSYLSSRHVITVVVENSNDEGILIVGLCDESKVVNSFEIIEILTVHGRRVSQLMKLVKDGKLFYSNKEKLEKFFRDSGFNSLQSEKLLELIPDKDTTKKSDSDTVNKKNNSEELGAVEVLEQNTYTDTCGLQPTYQILSSYNHLFDDAGSDFPVEKGGLEATLSKIKDVINKYNYQAARIAKHLKAETKEQSAFNIWHFCVNNITYKLDKEGYEELRTPNRTWKDRYTGVDCDDFSIFSSCILLQMGYMPQLAIVAFNHNSQFGHIYTVINSKIKAAPYNLGDHDGGAISGGVVIDPVLRTIFNKHPKGITKARIMNIQVLNGIETQMIQGFGAVLPADAITQKLIDHYNKLLILKKAGHRISNMNREMRKLAFMIKMNGTPERNLYLEIMPLVQYINKYGEFVFISEEAAYEAVKFLDKTVGKGLTEFELSYEDGKAVQKINGLGAAQLGELASIKSLFKKVKDKVKKTVKKVKEGAKKTVSKVKEGAKKVKDAVVRYNPITIAARNGLLLALSINFRNISRRLYIALMSQSELQSSGYTEADQVKMKKSYSKAENLFIKMGGKKENLRSTIIKGKNKKPLFGSPKKLNGIEGLGDPVTLAAITAALAPILTFVKFIKESGISFKKNEEDPTPESEDYISTEEEQVFLKSLNENTSNDEYEEEEDNENEEDNEGSDNTLLYIGGAAILGLVGIMALRSNK